MIAWDAPHWHIISTSHWVLHRRQVGSLLCFKTVRMNQVQGFRSPSETSSSLMSFHSSINLSYKLPFPPPAPRGDGMNDCPSHNHDRPWSTRPRGRHDWVSAMLDDDAIRACTEINARTTPLSCSRSRSRFRNMRTKAPAPLHRSNPPARS